MRETDDHNDLIDDLMDIYLILKIKNTNGFVLLSEATYLEILSNEKEKLMKQNLKPKVLVEYIKSSFEILINLYENEL